MFSPNQDQMQEICLLEDMHNQAVQQLEVGSKAVVKGQSTRWQHSHLTLQQLSNQISFNRTACKQKQLLVN